MGAEVRIESEPVVRAPETEGAIYGPESGVDDENVDQGILSTRDRIAKGDRPPQWIRDLNIR